MPSVHAFVLCWPGWEAAARHIAGALDGRVEHLTVFYKNDTGVDESGSGEWRRIPSERFYGWQFRESLGLNRGDVMLHVQADASFGNWPGLVARCRDAFATMPDLGVWSPNVYHSWYTPHRTRVETLQSHEVAAVTATDGVVWALSSAVTERLKRLDYSGNNLGWGLTETAAAIASTQNLSVAMDLTLEVKHPKGSGYDKAKALEQLRLFQVQLSAPQRAYLRMVWEVARLREWQRRSKYLRPGFWRTKLARLIRPEDRLAPPMLEMYGR